MGFGWLTGKEIELQVQNERITIYPYKCENLNPNSYNYTLSPILYRITNEVIDLKQSDKYEEIHIHPNGTKLMPGECYLGSTVEIFGSHFYASLITGRSSIGRKFITNHITAGLIDIGFIGTITLEIIVAKPTIIYPDITFGQIYWFSSAGNVNLYNGKYQQQRGPTLSKNHFDFLTGIGKNNNSHEK